MGIAAVRRHSADTTRSRERRRVVLIEHARVEPGGHKGLLDDRHASRDLGPSEAGDHGSRPIGVGCPARGQYDHVTAIAYRPDGRLIAAGDVRIRNVNDPNHPTLVGEPLRGHTNAVTDVAFAPDGRSLVSTALDRTIRIWRLSDAGIGSAAFTIRDLDDHADSVAFAPYGTLFATASSEGSIRLWDPATAAAAGPPIVTQDDTVSLVRWNPNGSQLAVAGVRNVGLLDLDPDRAIARICAASAWIDPNQWRTRVSPELPYANVCT
jgi:dipeptidyl aminopeptidase/acylaminoacyl peptidase